VFDAPPPVFVRQVAQLREVLVAKKRVVVERDLAVARE
jgi:hypothetical protein